MSYRDPPSDFSSRSLPMINFDGSVTYRGHALIHHPIHFNSGSGRFAVPDGTLSLGYDDRASFSEAFDHQFKTIGGLVVVSESVLQQSCLCPVELLRPVRLVDVTSGPALRKLGADAAIGDGTHLSSQEWSLAIWNHPEQPDGLLYRCRSAPELLSIALFARASSAVRGTCSENFLRVPARLEMLVDYFQCALIP
jgi:hypothetical protein